MDGKGVDMRSIISLLKGIDLGMFQRHAYQFACDAAAQVPRWTIQDCRSAKPLWRTRSHLWRNTIPFASIPNSIIAICIPTNCPIYHIRISEAVLASWEYSTERFVFLLYALNKEPPTPSLFPGAYPSPCPTFQPQVKMSAGHHDPRVLFSVNNITAYSIQNGEESPISVSGPQTLSLLMVPTSSPFADLSSSEPQSAAPEEDFYLHLHLPPELDLALPATTQIYHQPPRSYLIPRWDLGPDSGAFTRIEFPKIGSGPDRVTQEDVDTFETILAQCTAFLEREHPPVSKGHDAYNPAAYAPGEGYIGQRKAGSKPGQIVLIDEENGSVVGELSEGFDVVEGAGVTPGSKSNICMSKLKSPVLKWSQIPWRSSCPKKEKVIKSMLPMHRKNTLKWQDIRRTRTRPLCRTLR